MISVSVVADTPAARRVYLAVSLAVLLVTLLPFVSVTFAPLLDYPNHLARAYILQNIDHVPAFASHYESAWAIMPNLGMDAVFALLLPLFHIEVASRIFLCLIVLLSHLGAHVLAREIHGRSSWMAPLASFFVFSYGLFLGFMSYIMGVGVFYFAFAAWLRLWRTGSPWMLGLSSLLALVAYLTHLSAYGVLGIAVVMYIALDLRAAKHSRVLLGLVPLLAPLVLHLAVSTLSISEGMRWDGPLETVHFAMRLLRTYDIGADIAFIATFFGAVSFALWVSRARVGRAFANRRALVVGAALLVCFVVAPTWWNGSWMSFRFLLPGAVLTFLAFGLDLTDRRARWAYGVALVSLTVRALSVTVIWHGLDDRISGYVKFMDHVPLGAHVFVPPSDALQTTNGSYERSFHHMLHYLVIYREAATRGLFLDEGKQPLRRKPGVAFNDYPTFNTPPERIDWGPIFAGYDVLWMYRPPEAYRSWLGARCTTIDAWDDVVLYQGCTAR